MTHIHERVQERVYDGDSKTLDVEVDINVDTLHIDDADDGVDVTERVRAAVRKEIQAIQDERDENNGENR